MSLRSEEDRFPLMCQCAIEHLCVWRKIVVQYTDSVRSFPKDSIFACKTKNVLRTRARTSICSNGIHCTYVERKLLWNR